MVSLEYLGMGTAFTTQVVVEGSTKPVLSKIESAQAKLISWLQQVEETFSPFIADSELNRYLRGELDFLTVSEEMRFVLASCAQAHDATRGAFDANLPTGYNPSGFVKGWAIEVGFKRYLKPLLSKVVAANLNGGGDMQMETQTDSDWAFGIGIIDPFDKTKILESRTMKTGAIATSGIAERGAHIARADESLIQTTVIGQDLQEVDVWATALMVDPKAKLPSHLKAFIINKNKERMNIC